jgi:hypothetical protein
MTQRMARGEVDGVDTTWSAGVVRVEVGHAGRSIYITVVHPAVFLWTVTLPPD